MKLENLEVICGSTNEVVNELLGGVIEFLDDIYINTKHNHKWKCNCGNIIEKRTMRSVKKGYVICESCKYNIKSKYSNIDEITLFKGSTKEEVNRTIGQWVKLKDELYLGHRYKHNWICKCGNTIENRTWGNMKRDTRLATCNSCRYPESNNECIVCGRVGVKSKGMCYKHYRQFTKYGYTLDDNPRTNKDPNEFITYDDYTEIVLYNLKYEECGRAFIDTEDLEACKDYKWSMRKDGYVLCGHAEGRYLHRFIMNPPKDMCVDHINGNPLDNRKSNLRICTIQENSRNVKRYSHNTSGLTGVHYSKEFNNWSANIIYDNVCYHLGTFNNREDAIKSRLDAEKKYFGEFAPQRDIEEIV